MKRGGQIDPPPQEKLPSKSPAFLGLVNYQLAVYQINKYPS